MRKEFEALIGWANGGGGVEPVDPKVARTVVGAYVGTFDGSEGSGFIEAGAEAWTPLPFGLSRTFGRSLSEDEDLETLRLVVRGILLQGFNDPQSFSEALGGSVPLALHFGVRSQRGRAPKEKRKRQAFFKTSGSYVMRVQGQLPDLIPFLVLHSLVSSGAARIARCPAPKPYNAKERCGSFFLTGGKGQPRKFCSDKCRIRKHYVG